MILKHKHHNAKWPYAVCHYAECSYTECHCADSCDEAIFAVLILSFMTTLCLIILNAIILYVIMLSADIVSVIMRSV